VNHGKPTGRTTLRQFRPDFLRAGVHPTILAVLSVPPEFDFAAHGDGKR